MGTKLSHSNILAIYDRQTPVDPDCITEKALHPMELQIQPSLYLPISHSFYPSLPHLSREYTGAFSSSSVRAIYEMLPLAFSFYHTCYFWWRAVRAACSLSSQRSNSIFNYNGISNILSLPSELSSATFIFFFLNFFFGDSCSFFIHDSWVPPISIFPLSFLSSLLFSLVQGMDPLTLSLFKAPSLKVTMEAICRAKGYGPFVTWSKEAFSELQDDVGGVLLFMLFPP